MTVSGRLAPVLATLIALCAFQPHATRAQTPGPEADAQPAADSAIAADLRTIMTEDFSSGAAGWVHQKLDRRETAYSVVPAGADSALEGVAGNAAAGLVRRVSVPATERGIVSWRWRTTASLTRNDREREKKGDDFVGRIFLTFGGDPFTQGTRALAYVWAGQEPVGSVFANPYISDVMTIVLRSGNDDAGGWVREERDYVADFERLFGERPPPLTAIAILVDSDDTGATAVARFDDFRIQVAD